MTLVIAALFSFVGCARSTPLHDGGPDGSHEVDADQDEPTPRPLVDVLCVLDSDRHGSPSLGRDIASVTLDTFLGRVADEAGLTGDDMRIGVITANLGAPGLPVCQRSDGTSWSDEAILVTETYGDSYSCEDLPSDRPYLNADTVAYDGSCYFRVDSYPESCPYLQFLRALSMSFDRPENAVFFRPEAHLLVVIFSNRDDCSFADGSFMLPDLGTIFSPVSCINHQDELLDPVELAREVLQKVGDHGLSILFFGGEDHPVRIAESDSGILVPLYEPCEGGGSYDHVTPTPRIHDFLDELSRLRDDPELALRFDTCAVIRWRDEDEDEIIEHLADRVTR
jgi:hypothetical protein